VKIESVRVVRNRLSEMIKTLPAGPVIITRNGRPCAALVSLGEHTDLEAFLIAHNPRLTALIERGMSEPGGIPLAQVEREVLRGAKGKKHRRARMIGQEEVNDA
jgi:prevent-host-death family protein